MHRILLRTIVVDAPSDVHDRTRDFWSTALNAQPRPDRASFSRPGARRPAPPVVPARRTARSSC